MPAAAIRYHGHSCRSHGMNVEDRALVFSCREAALYGILSLPRQAQSCGVLIVVGGAQYRAGSHRQFTLLARDLAAHGFPVLRFDYRGMGDSEGSMRNFETIGDDICAAVDRFMAEAPSIRKVVIWGLCDGASAALLYAHQDPRIAGLVLVNPWARTEAGIAKTYLKHYYHARLMDAELWKKIGRGKFDYSAASRSLLQLIGRALGSKVMAGASDSDSLPDRMLHGFSRFKGRVLLILSGNDLTAREFSELERGSAQWQKLIRSDRVQRFELHGANHTFARRAWREAIAARTREWLGGQ